MHESRVLDSKDAAGPQRSGSTMYGKLNHLKLDILAPRPVVFLFYFFNLYMTDTSHYMPRPVLLVSLLSQATEIWKNTGLIPLCGEADG